MSQPLKPLLDAGVAPENIKVAAVVDNLGTVGWQVNASTAVDEIVVGVVGLNPTLTGAVAQCIEQLNITKGIDLVIVSNA